jgi:hypothetical protein
VSTKVFTADMVFGTELQRTDTIAQWTVNTTLLGLLPSDRSNAVPPGLTLYDFRVPTTWVGDQAQDGLVPGELYPAVTFQFGHEDSSAVDTAEGALMETVSDGRWLTGWSGSYTYP